ncbi:MAG: hypothetical protein J6R77_01605, partial [Clostridia bacterium]|nr:hypothetical protein [Clostridia bacterium]
MKETIKRYWRITDRFLTVVLCHILVAVALHLYPKFFPYPELAYTLLDGWYLKLLALLLPLPAFYSVVRITTIFDDELRDRFVEEDPKTFRGKWGFLIGQKAFWIKTLLYIAIFAVVPPELGFGVLAEVFWQNTVTTTGHLLVLAGAFPVFFALQVAARLSAMNYWRAWQRKEAVIYHPGEKVGRAYNKSVLSILSAYILGGLLLGAAIPLLISIWPFLWAVISSRAFITLVVGVLVFFIILYTSRIRRRRVFFKRLRAVCKEKGYTLSKPDAPYRSLFSMLAGETFSLRSEEHRYSCKFLCIKKRRVPLVLHPDGHCDFLHIYRAGKAEIWRRTVSYDFDWEGEGQKILLLQPVPNQVYDPAMQLMDNSDLVGHHKIFTGTAFLNALERDCV